MQVSVHSPNCARAFRTRVDHILVMCRKTPVFVKSAETAVEISQVFAKER